MGKRILAEIRKLPVEIQHVLIVALLVAGERWDEEATRLYGTLARESIFEVNKEVK